jgi:hypothetical protein
MSTRERRGAASKMGRRGVLAGVAALGLLGGMSLGVHPAGASVVTKVEICKAGQVSGSASFSVNNSTTAITIPVGTCRGVIVPPGVNTIRELPDTSGLTTLARIAINPTTAGTGNLATRTATVTVPTGGNVAVRFFNQSNSGVLKVCKAAGMGVPVGQSFTFTENAGGQTVGPFAVAAGALPGQSCSFLTDYQVGTKVNVAETATPGIAATSIVVRGPGSAQTNTNLSAGTVTATVGTGVTEVDYTNSVVVNQPPGYIEICKNAGDPFVAPGPWTFTLSQGNWSTTQSVLAGQCSGDVAVAPGQVNVAETFSAPNYVSSIAAIPSGNLLGSNLANGTATFAVASGAATTAVFTNDVQTGYVKVCKTLAPGSDALTGMPFNFNVNDAAGTQVITVIASAPGQTACSPDYSALPIGSVATVTEQSVPNVALTGVSVTPASADAGSTSTTAAVRVGPSINSVNFTNTALGWVEVCKNAADASTAGQTFNFTVNGGMSFPVTTGQCSQPMQVPVGTATIAEAQNANYYLANVSTVSVTDPAGTRLLSGPTANPATVLVPFGGVGNETIATFTNAVNQGAFKICTQQTSPDANLVGKSFPYSYTYTVNGVTSSGSVSLTVALGQATCSGVIATLPVVNANGTPVSVSVTSQVPSALSVDIAGILYQGNGAVTSAPPLPAAFPATVSFNLGGGMNVLTWTNGATH